MVEVKIPYKPCGAVQKLFLCRDKEVGLDGPAGTGKSRGVLEKFHLALLKYPNIRVLMVRKTRKSLTQSGMVTFEEKVLHPAELAPRGEIYFDGKEQGWVYPKGGLFAVSGMDDPQKIMSSEWDLIYEQEATELSLNDHEYLTVRCRNMKMPYNQVVSDCNPSWPTHWWIQRCQEGKMTRFQSKHEDNPVFFDQATHQWTPAGLSYLASLDNLSGVRFKRLRQGIWCAAEGTVYDEWVAEENVVDRFEIPKNWEWIWGIDFGYANPFSWGAFAIDPDGRLYLVHQIYKTARTVEDHCKVIMDVVKEHKLPRPIAVICDHDLEDRMTFEKHTPYRTRAAYKDISTGIEAMKIRIRPAGDRRRRFMVMRDSLVEKPDPKLDAEKLPFCIEHEFESYIWDDQREIKKEIPVKKYDHALDMARYVVCFVDNIGAPRLGIQFLR